MRLSPFKREGIPVLFLSVLEQVADGPARALASANKEHTLTLIVFVELDGVLELTGAHLDRRKLCVQLVKSLAMKHGSIRKLDTMKSNKL